MVPFDQPGYSQNTLLQWEPTLTEHRGADPNDSNQYPLVLEDPPLFYAHYPDLHLQRPEVVDSGITDSKDLTVNTLYDDLVEYWNLEEVSGNRTGARAGFVLTDINTVTSQTAFGRTVAEFTAANSEALSLGAASLQEGHPLNLSTELTLAAWFRPTAATIAAANWVVGGTAGSGYRLVGQTNSARGTLGLASVTSAVALVAGTWYFGVIQLDTSTGARTRKISINNGAFDTSAGGVIDPNTPTNFAIGRLPNANSQYFDGLVSCLGVWSRQLTAAEITLLYNNGTPRRYPF